jgi:hypothetical protein
MGRSSGVGSVLKVLGSIQAYCRDWTLTEDIKHFFHAQNFVFGELCEANIEIVKCPKWWRSSLMIMLRRDEIRD